MDGSHAPRAAFDGSSPPTFETLAATHHYRVHALVRRLLAWERDVDDVVQDVFVAALRGWNGFRGASKPETWLTAIAVRVCRSRSRRAALWRRLGWRQHAAAPLQTQTGIEGEQQETVARVQTALRELSTREREVIVLLHLQDMSAAEAADVLGMSRGALEVRASRARQSLRRALGDREGGST